MRYLVSLVFLIGSFSAFSNTILSLWERTDPSGKIQLHLLQAGTPWRPISALGFHQGVFTATSDGTYSYLFRSVPGQDRTEVWTLEPGKPPGFPKNIPKGFSALAPYSNHEAIGFTAADARVFLISDAGISLLTQSLFSSKVYDVSLARVAEDEIGVVVCYSPKTAFAAPTPHDHEMTVFKIQPGAQATVKWTVKMPRMYTQSRPCLSEKGVFYTIPDGASLQTLRHSSAPGGADHNSAIRMNIGAFLYEPLEPLWLTEAVPGSNEILYFRKVDGLHGLILEKQALAPLNVPDYFSSAQVEAATGRKGSYRMRGIFSVGFFPGSEPHPLREKLGALWEKAFQRRLVRTALVPEYLDPMDLAVILEQMQIESEWLDKLLTALSPSERLAFGLSKPGGFWRGNGAKFETASFLASLEKTPDCARILSGD